MKRKKDAQTLPWVGYVRVSTQDQAKSGLSLEAQETKVRAMAAVKGVPLLDVIVDEAESAKTLDREGVQRVLSMVRGREIDGVIIAKLDRLTRSVQDLGYLLELFEAKDVALVSTYETVDTSTANGRMILNITVTIAQWERETICERTRDALQAKLRRGEGAGNIPYGWFISTGTGGKLFKNASEQAILQEIVDLRKEGKSLRDVAARLNELGFKTRRGTAWKFQYVDNVLRSAARREGPPL